MTDQSPDVSGDAPNEILAAAKEHKSIAARRDKSKNWPLAKIGIAAGIGSAAIAGAALFAGRRKDRK